MKGSLRKQVYQKEKNPSSPVLISIRKDLGKNETEVEDEFNYFK